MVCIEPVQDYAKKIQRADNIEIFNTSIDQYKSTDSFDLITAFGVMQYFNEEEAYDVYSHLKLIAKDKSKLIVKNQFGLNNTVIVNNHSQELNMHYFSEYRTLDKEKDILKSLGFDCIEIVDIYPPSANRFSNTHFFALVVEYNAR